MPHRGSGLAAGLFAALIWPASTALADAQTFRERCVACHARASTLARSIGGSTVAEKTAWLEAFLATHHADDPAVRASLVTYLVGLTAK